jgi:hypothetical protein
MRFEVKDDTITSETLGKTDIYKIVEKIPFGFYVWNIGEHMGSDEYIPLCQDLYLGIKDDYSINSDTLRAIKLPKEEVELLREAAAWGVNSIETAKKAFLEVRCILTEKHEDFALAKAYKKPWKWYREHATQEAIEILRTEAKAN